MYLLERQELQGEREKEVNVNEREMDLPSTGSLSIRLQQLVHSEAKFRSLELPLVFPWLAGIQAHGPSSAIFLGVLVGRKVRN